jgi:hypothetical protein
VSIRACSDASTLDAGAIVMPVVAGLAQAAKVKMSNEISDFLTMPRTSSH